MEPRSWSSAGGSADASRCHGKMRTVVASFRHARMVVECGATWLEVGQDLSFSVGICRGYSRIGFKTSYLAWRRGDRERGDGHRFARLSLRLAHITRPTPPLATHSNQVIAHAHTPPQASHVTLRTLYTHTPPHPPEHLRRREDSTRRYADNDADPGHATCCNPY